ncbi:MAG TPA: dihydrofolate reductase [Pyrinomonadaceae bacterium]|nr:dihydrofolate reductase [Pyrinomonadaceae bacterium]
MALIGIVAVDRNNAIGRGGALPWHYSADLKFFKERTVGNVCVMGRRTWESLKKPLPNRLNVVLTRRLELESRPGVIILHDARSVLSLAPYLARDVYVIGGAEVFAAFRQEIDEWIVTRVPLAVEGADTFMPADFLDGFEPRETRGLGEDLQVTFYSRSK